MAYYPKSQIIPNQYTSGGEYTLFKNTITQPQLEYIGFYHKVSNGNIFTGKTPEDGPNKPLYVISPTQYEGIPSQNQTPQIYIPIDTSDDTVSISQEYINLKQITTNQQRTQPYTILTQPTQQDKNLGIFTRYFCKKNNENIYIEINKEQFTNLTNKESNIAWDLYTPKQVLWQIKGDQTQTYNANKTNVSLIEQRDKWYGFTQYFRDRFLKYYLDS